MNPIEKAVKQADEIIAFNAELERLSANPHLTVLKKGRLSPDGNVGDFTVEATFDPADRWSGGLARPFVTRAEAQRIVDFNNANTEDWTFSWDGEALVLEYSDDTPKERVSPTEAGLYDVGFGWCWEEVEERPTPANSTVVALGVAHQKAVALTKEQIIADVRSRTVSPAVFSFSDLHNFVDANVYGGLCDDDHFGLEGQDWIEFGNGVQDEVDSWLKQDGLKEVLGVEYDSLLAAWDAEAEVEDRVALVFAIDVTGFTPEQRGAIEAAVSAQLDDGTEDYPAPHSYESTTLDHDTERPIIDALQVGLGF